MSYIQYYSLHEQPFTNSLDSRYFFHSKQHEGALVRMQHAAETMSGLAVLVGEIGTGKSTLARKILDNLPEREYEAALLVVTHSDVSPDWFLRKVARQIGVEEPDGQKGVIVNQIYERLLAIHDAGRKTVIIIDEANMLKSHGIMEEVRGLLNIETDGTKLITFTLVGLPDLDEWLQTDAPLRQRIAVRFTLSALTPPVAREYVCHRLKIAGSDKQIFSAEAHGSIFSHSRGIPRLINTICDNALLEGFLAKRQVISHTEIEDVVIGLGL